VTFTCNYLFMCSGYYSYKGGYTPEFAGIEQFAAPSCTRRHGRRISTTPASAWS
jgi:hypothetical protein